MTLLLNIQNESEFIEIPIEKQFFQWVSLALKFAKYNKSDAELTVRIVDYDESQSLNFTYRQKDKPTNVLSFPSELPDFIPDPLLGDLVICAPLVSEEAAEQGKDCIEHWTHLTVHGVLHLLGFDHIEENDANEMELLEVEILSQLNIQNPYLIKE